MHHSLPLVLILLLSALLLTVGLLFLLARRQACRQETLPLYKDEKRLSTSTTSSHRRILARPSEPAYFLQEKQGLNDSPPASPTNTLPAIHITFPEEVDATGKKHSGRVVVVRIGDTTVGLEPLESLPAYQRYENERFQSVDLDRVGGLVEKARNAPRKENQ